MQLLYTPTSHFARKARIIAGGIGVELELVNAGNVANLSGNQLELNPLMKVPTLFSPDGVIFDSDVICAWLVRRFDPADRFGVLGTDLALLNARTVMNGVMSAEVELALAARTGLDIQSGQRFDKFRQAIAAGLSWLEANFSASFAFPCNDFHLVCLWDHLILTRMLPAHPLPRLLERVEATRRNPVVAATAIPEGYTMPTMATPAPVAAVRN